MTKPSDHGRTYWRAPINTDVALRPLDAHALDDATFRLLADTLRRSAGSRTDAVFRPFLTRVHPRAKSERRGGAPVRHRHGDRRRGTLPQHRRRGRLCIVTLDETGIVAN